MDPHLKLHSPHVDCVLRNIKRYHNSLLSHTDFLLIGILKSQRMTFPIRHDRILIFGVSLSFYVTLSWVEYISALFEIKHTYNIYQKVVFGEQQDSLDTQLILSADKCCCQHAKVAWVFSFVCSAVPADQCAVMLSLHYNEIFSDHP